MKEVIIRRMKTDEYFLLKEFTYHAIYVPTGVNMPPKHIVELPELKVYYQDFGTRAGDICLIADNDEIFDNDVEEKILKAYQELPQADIIVFNLHNKQTKLKNKIYKLKRLECLRVCSWQITFIRKAIVDNKLNFDIKLGAGTGNGAGEENKFLLDAYDKGLKIYHYPINIARMVENESTWFNGYDEEYFYKHGMTIRYILGFWMGCVYAIYFLVFKYGLYKNDITFYNAFKQKFKGIFENKLAE